MIKVFRVEFLLQGRNHPNKNTNGFPKRIRFDSTLATGIAGNEVVLRNVRKLPLPNLRQMLVETHVARASVLVLLPQDSHCIVSSSSPECQSSPSPCQAR